jgi:hypothetical protein
MPDGTENLLSSSCTSAWTVNVNDERLDFWVAGGFSEQVGNGSRSCDINQQSRFAFAAVQDTFNGQHRYTDQTERPESEETPNNCCSNDSQDEATQTTSPPLAFHCHHRSKFAETLN